jgi:hypothetical protein
MGDWVSQQGEYVHIGSGWVAAHLAHGLALSINVPIALPQIL